MLAVLSATRATNYNSNPKITTTMKTTKRTYTYASGYEATYTREITAIVADGYLCSMTERVPSMYPELVNYDMPIPAFYGRTAKSAREISKLIADIGDSDVKLTIIYQH